MTLELLARCRACGCLFGWSPALRADPADHAVLQHGWKFYPFDGEKTCRECAEFVTAVPLIARELFPFPLSRPRPEPARKKRR